MATVTKWAMIFLIGLGVTGHGLYAKDDPGIKLGRGLTNIVASPGEYYVQTAKLSTDYDPLTRLFSGFVKGTYHMGKRIGIGTYEVLTFAVPWPAGYGPVVQPATVMDAIKQQADNKPKKF